MRLNTIKPAPGAKRERKRVGRGIGSGSGKTCGRGHKGQKSRSGVSLMGFEGGQVPQHRRIPKSGFTSRQAQHTDEVRLHELNQLPEGTITLDVLRKAGIITSAIKRVKVIAKGELSNKVILSSAGIRVTAGARKAIEALGGKIEEVANEG